MTARDESDSGQRVVKHTHEDPVEVSVLALRRDLEAWMYLG